MGLILRMYEPSSGKIWIGKHEYNTVNLTFLRECFAYVTQEPVMFSCTIRENLLYANPLASSEQIEKALEDAGCKSIAAALPDGLDTKLAGKFDFIASLMFKLMNSIALDVLDSTSLVHFLTFVFGVDKVALPCRDVATVGL